MINRSAAVTLLLVLAAGCGGSGDHPASSPSAPLRSGVGSLTECIPDPAGTTTTNGFTVLDNQSTGTAIIKQVSFYGDDHLRLIEAVVVPMRFDAIGSSKGWPPDPGTINQPGLRWDKRVPAVGARIPPGSDKAGYRNLVIAMRPTAPRASSAGVDVLYRENGQQYELRTHIKTVVLAAKSC